ncbi:MAG: transglutaminase-like domain-containing protein [Alistipes sp.]|nr:transglutaminase-like domain-containing protein [Alistipes sp.]
MLKTGPTSRCGIWTATIISSRYKSMLKNNSKLIGTFADPVLIYASLAMMSVMYNYKSSLALIYGIAAYVSGWLLFRLFNYINKHHFIGFFAYIILFAADIQGARLAIEKGGENYPLPWGVWFLTPQNAMDYNGWYAFSVFLLFQVFLMSVIYYFTYVRYRMFMNFLILMIPFTIYDKEADDMKIGFIIPLVVGFILMMMNFRQLRDTDRVQVVHKPAAWLSAGVFTAIFAVAATIIPKPEITADRTVIDNLINADALTDRFMSMISVFRSDSEGEQFRGQTSEVTMYYVVSPEPMRLKTAAFTSYDFEHDAWSAGETDSSYKIKRDVPFDLYNGGGLTEAVRLAAELDSEFAAEYGLESLVRTELYYPKRQSVQIYSAVGGSDSVPVPQGAERLSLTSYGSELGLSGSGTVFTHEGEFGRNENFSFMYTPDEFFSHRENRAAAELLAGIENYGDMLDDALISLRLYSYEYTDEENEKELNYSIETLEYMDKYYGDDWESLLDYGGSERIKALAEEVTAGLESEYDKAKALERYFLDSGYTYDLSYRKEKGDNAEDFLFDSRTGVCYEYATAMTLMARSIGIPARYCEGFNMQTPAQNGEPGRYIVTTMDAHGFPELYIKGYGWLSFEPTMSFDTGQQQKSTVAGTLTKIGIGALVISVLMLIIIFLMPKLSHRIFLIRSGRWSADKASEQVMKRLCRLCGIGAVYTAGEAADEIYRMSGADITNTAKLFERHVYGGEKLDANHKSELIKEYISAYEAIKEAKRTRKKRRRKRA